MNEPNTINRGSVIIIPKQPFYDWANNVFPEDNFVMSAETMKEYKSYLLDEYILEEEKEKKMLEDYWEFIFKDQLFGACMDEMKWPDSVSWKLFTEWFDFHFSSMVIDLEDGSIEREEY